ncbi:hypothetical protein D3C81_1460850 [compost metagenome]
MTTITKDSDFSMSMNGEIWRIEHNWELAADAIMAFGFAVPAGKKMVALGREYFTFSTGLKVDLYESVFTGGTNVYTLNRDLSKRLSPPPIQFKHSVTGYVTTDRITGFEVEAVSSIRVDKRGDQTPFLHEPSKSYVLAITNSGSGNQPFSLAIDFRMTQPFELS